MPRSEVYKAVPDRAGPFAYIEQQALEESGDIDILFVGSSLLWAGIDTHAVAEALSARIRRPATVVMLGSNWEGADLPYVLLHDLLSHRHVRLVVLSTPTSRFTHDTPHVQAFRWMRFGEDQEAADALLWSDRLSVYAAEVLGAPRQVVSWLRPNMVYPEEVDAGWLREERLHEGYYGAPFVRDDSEAKPVSAATATYDGSPTGPFRFVGPPPGSYERVYLRETGRLLERNGSAVAALHVVTARERGQEVVRERFRWPDALGVPCDILGVPAATLFAGMSEERLHHYYYDEHLNGNGAARFTAAVAPAIVETYLRAGARSAAGSQ
ncbi:MAG: hypothetical protein ACRELB_13690 [Polyangiaceae bacterium]